MRVDVCELPVNRIVNLPKPNGALGSRYRQFCVILLGNLQRCVGDLLLGRPHAQDRLDGRPIQSGRLAWNENRVGSVPPPAIASSFRSRVTTNTERRSHVIEPSGFGKPDDHVVVEFAALVHALDYRVHGGEVAHFLPHGRRYILRTRFISSWSSGDASANSRSRTA